MVQTKVINDEGKLVFFLFIFTVMNSFLFPILPTMPKNPLLFLWIAFCGMHKCFYLPVPFFWLLFCDLKSIHYFEADYQMLQVIQILGKSCIPNIVMMKRPFVRLFAVSTLASSDWSDSPNTESPYFPLCHWTQKMAQVWAALSGARWTWKWGLDAMRVKIAFLWMSDPITVWWWLMSIINILLQDTSLWSVFLKI